MRKGSGIFDCYLYIILNRPVNYFITFCFILSRYSPPSWDRNNYSGGVKTITVSTTCILILLYIVYSRRRDKKKQREREIQFINTIKAEGIKITIGADKCKIISEKYKETEDYYIECLAKVNFTQKLFKSKAIKMDKKTLEIKLYNKKEIDIYYNPRNKKCFFDLDFLNDTSS
ncbi:hypothetical protein GCM10007424_04320 [Flavobacterium suaedae]|uniref:Uncharacterized protein n=1 Tax=Flavobacterium suaedae TaxID=1767027 RepID=A0ABQ1JJE3_9FLAO|nr:hypothetical protein [Flavobacterium suaedae]GGB67470.1 hypothetical protein GCM10007424_04320 [Flavobacterium suaedae]